MSSKEQIKTINQLLKLCDDTDELILKQIKIILLNHLKRRGRL